MLFLDRYPLVGTKSTIEVTPTGDPTARPLVFTATDVRRQEFDQPDGRRISRWVAKLDVANPGGAYHATQPRPGTAFAKLNRHEQMTFHCATGEWLAFNHPASGQRFEVKVEVMGDSPGKLFVRMGFLDDARHFSILRGEVVERRRAAATAAVTAVAEAEMRFDEWPSTRPIEGRDAMRQLYPPVAPPLRDIATGQADGFSIEWGSGQGFATGRLVS